MAHGSWLVARGSYDNVNVYYLLLLIYRMRTAVCLSSINKPLVSTSGLFYYYFNICGVAKSRAKKPTFAKWHSL